MFLKESQANIWLSFLWFLLLLINVMIPLKSCSLELLCI
jgi:hypothetical protein